MTIDSDDDDGTQSWVSPVVRRERNRVPSHRVQAGPSAHAAAPNARPRPICRVHSGVLCMFGPLAVAGRLRAVHTARRRAHQEADSGGSDMDCSAATIVERRIDPADGNPYTKREYVDHYGGMAEWLSAAHELRMDPSDNQYYTQAEFAEYYGGSDEWVHAARLGRQTSRRSVPVHFRRNRVPSSGLDGASVGTPQPCRTGTPAAHHRATTPAAQTPPPAKVRLNRSQQMQKDLSRQEIACMLAGRCGCGKEDCLQVWQQEMEWHYPDRWRPGIEAVRALRQERYAADSEKEWIFASYYHARRLLPKKEQKPSSSRSKLPPKIYELDFKVEGIPVCMQGWHRMAGWACTVYKSRSGSPQPRSRNTTLMARVCAGLDEATDSIPVDDDDEKAKRRQATRTHHCRLWIQEYLRKVSDSAPAPRRKSGLLYYPKVRPGFIYLLYKEEVKQHLLIVASGFHKAWRERMEQGIVIDGSHYELRERTVRARGFKKCEICTTLQDKYRDVMSKRGSQAQKDAIRQKYMLHLKEVRECRDIYAFTKYLSSKDPELLSAALDAAAQHGHRLPILKSENPKFRAMEKLQMKITGFLAHGEEKGYYAVVTPPWVKHGASLTCTVLMQLVAWGVLKGKKRLYLQIDGASDNVAYTALYFAVWLLLMSQQRRFGDLLVLEEIRLSRLPVGHTHIDIDQVFSVLSRWIWGTRTNQHLPDDVFMPAEFEKVIALAHKNLKKVYTLGAAFDFDALFEPCKCPETDKKIKNFHVFELKADTKRPGKVFMRTKDMMNTPDEDWKLFREGLDGEGQYWPNTSNGDMPGPDMPPLAPFCDWTKKDEVIKSLRWFAAQPHRPVETDRAKKLLDYIETIPESPAEASTPFWPTIVAEDAAAAVVGAEQVALPAPQVPAVVVEDAPQVPMPFGITDSELRRRKEKSAANSAFQQLRSFKKGNFLVVQHPDEDGKPILDVGVAKADTDLGNGEKFEVDWWINPLRGNAADNRRQLEAAQDLNKHFMPKPGGWVDTLDPTDPNVIVFWAGKQSTLLTGSKRKGKIKAGVMRTLVLIEGFPLQLADSKTTRLEAKPPLAPASPVAAPAPAPEPLAPAMEEEEPMELEAAESADDEEPDHAYLWFREAAMDLFERKRAHEAGLTLMDFLTLQDEDGKTHDVPEVWGWLVRMENANKVLLDGGYVYAL